MFPYRLGSKMLVDLDFEDLLAINPLVELLVNINVSCLCIYNLKSREILDAFMHDRPATRVYVDPLEAALFTELS